MPDPALRPHGFEIEKGGLLDLDETADQLVACGYERVDQVEERGQFAIRGDILDVYPATEERAVRCELFDVEVERLTWFSTFTQRSLGEAERVEIAPAAELAPEHRELAEIAAASDEDERPDVADVLPVDRFCELLDLVPDDALVAIAAEEELAPALRDYWEDVTTSFHDEDAHQLYVKPEALDAALDERAAAPAVEHLAGPAASSSARRRRTPRPARCKEAEPELEKLVRGGYRTFVAWARRGEAERAAATTWPACSLPSSTGSRLRRTPRSRSPTPACATASSRPSSSSRCCPSTGCFAAGAGVERPSAAAGRSRRSPTCGPARRWSTRTTASRCFAGFETKTVGGVTRDYLELEYRDGDRVFVPSDQLAQDQPLRGRRRRRPAALEARRQAVGADEAAARAAPPRRSPAS